MVATACCSPLRSSTFSSIVQLLSCTPGMALIRARSRLSFAKVFPCAGVMVMS